MFDAPHDVLRYPLINTSVNNNRLAHHIPTRSQSYLKAVKDSGLLLIMIAYSYAHQISKVDSFR
jgi:hypothetical protein